MTTPTTYMLMLWGDPNGSSDLGEVYTAHDRFAAACAAQGHEIVGGEEVGSVPAGMRLRVTPSGVSVLDGPYAETTEQIGGFYLVRTPDPAGLLRLAVPLVEAEGSGTVELRPVIEHEDEEQPTTAAGGATT